MAFLSGRLAITAAALVLYSVSNTSALAGAGFKRITAGNEFNQLVVGKKITLGKNYLTIKKNGSVTGKFRGETLKGNWAWRDGYWCRTLLTHSKNTDCQTVEVEGNQFRFTRERGKGDAGVYTRK